MSERDYDYELHSIKDFEEYNKWEKATRLTWIHNNHESHLAFATIKACIPCEMNGIKVEEDVLNNGYALFDYTMYCFFIFRAFLCAAFPRPFVELYGSYMQTLMKMYFEKLYDIPEETTGRLIASRAEEYDKIVANNPQEASKQILEAFCQFVERDLADMPETDSIVIRDFSKHCRLYSNLVDNSIKTLIILKREVSFVENAIEFEEKKAQAKLENVKQPINDYERKPQSSASATQKIQPTQKNPEITKSSDKFTAEKRVNRERNQRLIRDYVNDTAKTESPKSTGQNYTKNRKRYRTLATKTVAAAVSVGLCIVLFLVFLFSVFTTEIETYICYTTNTGECYHAEYCQYLYRSSHRTTVYKASREYRPCSKCDPCQEEYKTTITERNFPGAVFASLPIPIILYFVLTRIKYEEDAYI